MPVSRPAIVFAAVCCAAMLAARATAQATNEFDFDATQLPVTTITPNGSPHTISTSVTYTGQNLVLNAPLTVRSGAELRLVRSVLTLAGDLVMEEGSRVTVIDSSLLFPNTYSRQYDLFNQGGLLHTERAVVGTEQVGTSQAQMAIANMRGAWLARHTVVPGVFCLLGDGRTGTDGNPLYKGGSVFAEGLYEGDKTDAVHAGGMGDVSLTNGTISIAQYYDAGANTQPVTATADLQSRVPLTIVYGDPLVHHGVTQPIARSPCRLELRNHRAASWQYFVVNVSSSGPLNTITLRNADDIICSIRGADLVGTPVLGGPWSSHYADMPGLPSTQRPGHHALPPSCSVRLGNVMFQSGPGVNDWNRIRFWGLYARGTATNLTVVGPSAIAELRLTDGRLSLTGSGSFDMGLYANTARLLGTADLQLTNVTLSEIGTGATLTGLVEANENSRCTITDARSGPVRLMTTSPGASITASNVYGVSNAIVDTTRGGSVQVVQATPVQDWDLQNLDFEASLLSGGVPSYWTAQYLTGSLSTDAASGSKSFQAVAQAANAWMRKQLVIPPESYVTVLGSVKVVQSPGGSAQLRLQAANGSVVASRAVDLQRLNVWQTVHVPLLTVGSGAATTAVSFLATGVPATARLDAFRAHIGSWWDNDNLGNLAFEGEYRFQGQPPESWTTPDGWRVSSLQCAPDSGSVRPGALAGSRSVRLTLSGSTMGSIKKDLTFLRAGDTLDVRGWVRGVSANANARAAVIVGNGPTFYVVGLGNNQSSPPLPFDGNWRQFQVTYVVPSNPSFTRLDFGAYDVPGTQCWYDDITVDIR